MSTQKRETIVCLSSQPWEDGMWTNKQHIMSRLAREHRVFYVSFGPKPLPQLLREKKRQNVSTANPLSAALDPIVSEHAGVTVLDFLGPRLFVRAAGRSHPWSVFMTYDVRRALLARYLKREGIADPILWVYHPGYGPAVAKIPHRLLVYDCVDEYAEFPEHRGDAEWLRAREAELCQEADLVFATSVGLYDKKRPLNPEHTFLVHNVGDFEHFQRASAPQTKIPSDIDSLPRPIVGFVGAVSNYKLNIEWLLELARRHREYSLVVVGPVGVGDPGTNVEALKREANVHLLGHRAYEQLPGYVKAFDLSVIPYRINEYTAYSFPIKFFELLAAGSPLVTSELPALRDYWQDVRVAKDADDFVRQCEDALANPGVDRERRIALSAANTWEHRVERLMSHVNRALAEKDARAGARG